MNIESLVKAKANPNIPEIAPGDTVKVSVRIIEGGKGRIQIFQGVVIGVKHNGNGANFTVRHVTQGIGVERTFPFLSPLVEKVEIVRHGKVRRAKLYYLRGLSGKAARRKVKRIDFVKKQGLEPEIAEIITEPEIEPAIMEQEQEVENIETTAEQVQKAEVAEPVAELEQETEDASAAEEEQKPPTAESSPEQEQEPEIAEPVAELERETEDATAAEEAKEADKEA